MEQRFQLKEYGNLSLFEQAQMPADERAWWMRRLNEENKKKQEREKGQMGSMPRPRMPSISKPSMPSRRR